MENLKLDVLDVATSYKNFYVSNVNFVLNSGDIMGLLGGSGSGKSTLIKTIVGLKRLESGSINFYINNARGNLQQFLGYSPQENSLFPYLTLEENIITFGKLRNLNKNYIRERMDFLLNRLRLEDARKKRITEFSGGMTKRADLIITLLHDPELIILDEPFAGLDFVLINFIWGLIHELSAQGKIIIVSSHLLPDIKKHCNDIGFISAGHFYNARELLNVIKEKNLFSIEEMF